MLCGPFSMWLLLVHLNDEVINRRNKRRPTRLNKKDRKKRPRIKSNENRKREKKRRSGRLRNVAENKKRMRNVNAKYNKIKRASDKSGLRCKRRIKRILSRWSEPKENKNNMAMGHHPQRRQLQLYQTHRHLDKTLAHLVATMVWRPLLAWQPRSIVLRCYQKIIGRQKTNLCRNQNKKLTKKLSNNKHSQVKARRWAN